MVADHIKVADAAPLKVKQVLRRKVLRQEVLQQKVQELQVIGVMMRNLIPDPRPRLKKDLVTSVHMEGLEKLNPNTTVPGPRPPLMQVK